MNLSERDYQRKKNKWLPKLFEWVKVRALSGRRGAGGPRLVQGHVPNACVGCGLGCLAPRLASRPALALLNPCVNPRIPPRQAHGGDPIIPFSGALESKLLDMPEDERATYCKEVRAVHGRYMGGTWAYFRVHQGRS